MYLQSKSTQIWLWILYTLWLGLTGWWVYINFFITATDSQRYAFGAVYGILAIFGASFGVYAARKWGGVKSSLGLALLLLGLGLAAAEFGQLAFSYYNIIKGVEIPYPSVADIGFFGSIPLYIAAGLALSRVVGVKYSLKSASKKVAFLILPVVGLAISYVVFLRGYVFAGSPFFKIFLDFGYPLGQALYVSIALMIYLSSRKQLGGVMKRRTLLLLAAFLIQYCADFNFLYQTLHGTWKNGGYGDYLYLLAYTFMSLTLILFSYIPHPSRVGEVSESAGELTPS